MIFLIVFLLVMLKRLLCVVSSMLIMRSEVKVSVLFSVNSVNFLVSMILINELRSIRVMWW